MQTSDFNSWLSELELNTENMTSSQLASLHANYQGRTDANDADIAAVGGMIFASSDPVAVEDKRIRQIEAACRGDWDDRAERVQELKASAVGGELDVDELLIELRNLRKERIMADFGNLPPAARNNRDMHPQIEAAIALIGGITSPEKYYSEEVLDAADKMRSSVSLQQLIMGEAVRRGYPARPGEGLTQGNLRQVLTAAFHPQITATGFSTINLPTTLNNVANKFLRDGFNSVDQTALRICAVKPVTNFKLQTTISLTGAMMFQPVGPDGELKHGQLGEEVYTNQASTSGIIFTITRVDLLNDDLDSLTAVPKRIGRGGMLKLNDLVWSLFLNNGAFFTSGRGNLITDDLDLGGLAAAERAFINQVDQDGNPLGVMPAILLVPPSLRATALVLMNSQLTVTSDGGTMPSGNIWKNRFSVESSPYLEMSRYSGYSAAAWYLLAAPNQVPVIEIAALNGNVQPTVETADVDFAQLGVSMRGYSDIGVSMQEYRGGVRSDGSEV